MLNVSSEYSFNKALFDLKLPKTQNQAIITLIPNKGI